MAFEDGAPGLRLSAPDLSQAIAAISGGTFSRVLFRAIHSESLYGFHRTPRYPQPQPLHSLAAPAHGGRFTPRGGAPSLYLAEDTETALAEANPVNLAILQQNPSLISPMEPTVLIAATVHLESVLDLSDAHVQAALGTDNAELTGPWRIAPTRGLAPTQQLGAAVFAAGTFQAIRYPSARHPGGRCLVVFTGRLSDPSFVEVHDPRGNLSQRLP